MDWYEIFSNWNGNKVMCDLVQHDLAGIYGPFHYEKMSIQYAPISISDKNDLFR